MLKPTSSSRSPSHVIFSTVGSPHRPLPSSYPCLPPTIASGRLPGFLPPVFSGPDLPARHLHRHLLLPSPLRPHHTVVAGIDLNHDDITGYLPEELGLLTDLALFHINPLAGSSHRDPTGNSPSHLRCRPQPPSTASGRLPSSGRRHPAENQPPPTIRPRSPTSPDLLVEIHRLYSSSPFPIHRSPPSPPQSPHHRRPARRCFVPIVSGPGSHLQAPPPISLLIADRKPHLPRRDSTQRPTSGLPSLLHGFQSKLHPSPSLCFDRS